MRISDWSSDVCSSDLVTHVLHHVARLRHRAEPAVAERTDQRLQIGFVDRRCGIAEREPIAVAFVHFLPVVELVRDGEREDFYILHDRRAVPPALPLFIAADRSTRSDERRVGKSVSVDCYPG